MASRRRRTRGRHRVGTAARCRALVLAAGILPAGSPALRDLALECLRRCPAAEAPPPRLALALRMALGIEGGDGAPAALREARRSFLREELELDGAPAGAPLRVPPRLEPPRAGAK